MKLLLLSNSRSPDGAFLQWPRAHVTGFLGKDIRDVLFVPYAAVPATRESHDAYVAKVRAAFNEMGYGLLSIHEASDPAEAVQQAAAIVVGGGNSFQLLAESYRQGILELISRRVRGGTPYIGWSAGSNFACPGIWTTNDMPIVEPPSLRALGLVSFQINPHFTDAQLPGHQGETRCERIAQFLALHREKVVVGLRECALLRVVEGKTRVFGTGARVFRAGGAPYDLQDGAELVLT